MELLDNLSYQGKKANFTRDQFGTIQEMKAFPERSLDEGHISFCLETGKRYKYSSQNTNDGTLGKWRLVVDTALDTTSENPVQNKLITERFNSLDTTIEELEERLNAKITALDQKVDTQGTTINNRITTEVSTLNNTIDTKLAALDNKIQGQMTEMRDDLEAQIEQVKFDVIQLISDLFKAFDEIYALDDLLTEVEDILDIRELVRLKTGNSTTDNSSSGSFGSLFLRIDEIREKCGYIEEILAIEELMPVLDEDNSGIDDDMERIFADIEVLRTRVKAIQRVCDIIEFLPETDDEKLWVEIKDLERQLDVDGNLMPTYLDIPTDLKDFKVRLQTLHEVYGIKNLVSIKDVPDPVTHDKIERMIADIQDTTDSVVLDK